MALTALVREERMVRLWILASAAGIAVLYGLGQQNGRFLYVLSNGLPPLLAFIAFCTAGFGLVRNKLNLGDRISKVWLGYAVGMLLWFLGELTWAVYTLWFWIPIPFPSPADGFWLAGYIPLMFAILIQAWPFRDFFSSRKMLTVILSVFGLAVLLLGVVVPPTYASNGQDMVSLVVSLAYPLLDVTLLFAALPLSFLFRKGSFWRPFLFVIVGLILTFLGDILFTWATLTGVYYDGSYLELFFHWSYLTLAYGFYLRLRHGTATNMLE